MFVEGRNRKALVLAAVVMLVISTLAACSNPSEQAAPEGEGGEFHGAYPYLLPPEGHFNTFAANGIFALTIYHDVMEQPLAMYKWAAQEYMPLMATDWGFNPPDEFTVTLREGARWSDGSEFTSDDVVTTFTILRWQEQLVWDYLESVEADGKYDLTFTMKDPSTVVERYVLRERIRADSVYGKFADEAQKLFEEGDNAGLKKLRTELEEFRPKEMVVSGPFQIDKDSMTESQLTMEKVDSAWNADQVNFDKLVIYNGETPAVTPIALSQDIDYATHGFPVATEKQFIKQGMEILRPPTYSGPALYFNYDNVKPAADPRVRQAIAMAIDRDENGTVSLGQSAKRSEYMTGVSDITMRDWLTEDQLNQMNSYAYDPDQAARVFEDLGFNKQGGVWVSPDGEKMQYELNAPAEFADWSAAAENLAQQLTNFGIKTTVRTITFTQYETLVSDGRFELAIQVWGQGHPHPHFSWAEPFFTYNTDASGGGMQFSLQQDTRSVGEVDLGQLILDSASGLNENEQKAAVERMATAFNELLPIIPLWERYGNNPALDGVRVTGWPEQDDPIYQNSPYEDSFTVEMILDGTLESVQ